MRAFFPCLRILTHYRWSFSKFSTFQLGYIPRTTLQIRYYAVTLTSPKFAIKTEVQFTLPQGPKQEKQFIDLMLQGTYKTEQLLQRFSLWSTYQVTPGSPERFSYYFRFNLVDFLIAVLDDALTQSNKRLGIEVSQLVGIIIHSKVPIDVFFVNLIEKFVDYRLTKDMEKPKVCLLLFGKLGRLDLIDWIPVEGLIEFVDKVSHGMRICSDKSLCVFMDNLSRGRWLVDKYPGIVDLWFKETFKKASKLDASCIAQCLGAVTHCESLRQYVTPQWGRKMAKKLMTVKFDHKIAHKIQDSLSKYPDLVSDANIREKLSIHLVNCYNEDKTKNATSAVDFVFSVVQDGVNLSPKQLTQLLSLKKSDLEKLDQKKQGKFMQALILSQWLPPAGWLKKEYLESIKVENYDSFNAVNLLIGLAKLIQLYQSKKKSKLVLIIQKSKVLLKLPDIILNSLEGLHLATISYIPRGLKILRVKCSDKFWEDFWSTTMAYIGLTNKEVPYLNDHQRYNLLKGLFELEKVPPDDWWKKFINATRPEHSEFAFKWLQLFLDMKQSKNEQFAKLEIPDEIVGRFFQFGYSGCDKTNTNKLIKNVELMTKLEVSPGTEIPSFWNEFCKMDSRLDWQQINQLNNIISSFGGKMPKEFIAKIRDIPM